MSLKYFFLDISLFPQIIVIYTKLFLLLSILLQRQHSHSFCLFCSLKHVYKRPSNSEFNFSLNLLTQFPSFGLRKEFFLVKFINSNTIETGKEATKIERAIELKSFFCQSHFRGFLHGWKFIIFASYKLIFLF